MSKLQDIINTLKAADDATARIVHASVPACHQAGNIAAALAALLTESGGATDKNRAALTRSAAKAASVALAMVERANDMTPSPRSLAGHKILAGGSPKAAALQALWLVYRDAALANIDVNSDLHSIECQAGKRGTPVAKPLGKAQHANAAYAVRFLIATLGAVAQVSLTSEDLAAVQAEAEAAAPAERAKRDERARKPKTSAAAA